MALSSIQQSRIQSDLDFSFFTSNKAEIKNAILIPAENNNVLDSEV